LPKEVLVCYLLSIHKWSFCPISTLCSKNNPRNINYMPAVIFFACLDLEQKSLFMDGHYPYPDPNKPKTKNICHKGTKTRPPRLRRSRWRAGTKGFILLFFR
jgi:hypothetical protein